MKQDNPVVTKPQIEKISKNKIAFIMNERSIRLNIARKMVEIIIPVVQTQLSLLNVP
jgi:hypothetical protein